jgi:hypothetical protein
MLPLFQAVASSTGNSTQRNHIQINEITTQTLYSLFCMYCVFAGVFSGQKAQKQSSEAFPQARQW